VAPGAAPLVEGAPEGAALMPAYRYAGHVYRYRRYSRSRVHPGAIGAAVATALLLAATHPHHGHARAASLTTARIPAGGSYTPASWAAAFLGAAGEPATACNLGAVTAWESAEGGNWSNQAAFNPLNSTQPAPGSTTFQSAGPGAAPIRIYTSWHQGLEATAATITNGLYQPVLSALHAGNDAQSVANAVAGSPWGTGSFGANC
jgi:hypothetical protein